MKFEKPIAVTVCVLGVAAVACGMIWKLDGLFVIGLFFIVGGYLIIRRKLKSNARK